MSNSDDFWQALQQLVQQSQISIDRPKGTAHPKYGDLIYPSDYGYLEHTTTTDGADIDVWRGSLSSQMIDALICTVDLLKRDVEIKILIGCTDAEIEQIEHFHNRSANMKGVLIRKPFNAE